MDKITTPTHSSPSLSELERLIESIVQRLLEIQSSPEDIVPEPAASQSNGLDFLASSAQLLQEAIALNTETPILSIVETALREYVAHRKRLQVIELFGTLDYEDDYDYKQHAKKSYPAYEP